MSKVHGVSGDAKLPSANTPGPCGAPGVPSAELSHKAYGTTVAPVTVKSSMSSDRMPTSSTEEQQRVTIASGHDVGRVNDCAAASGGPRARRSAPCATSGLCASREARGAEQ